MIVYQVTNLINNKKYFGVTGRTLNYAIYSHRARAKAIMRRMKLKPTARMGKSPFHKALVRYGEYNFNYSTVDTFSDENDAYAYKELLIKKSNTMNPKYGYNCTTGGNKSFINATHVNKRISVANTGKKMPESFVKIMKERIGILHPSFGHKHSKVVRKRMSQAQLNSNYVQSEESKKRTSQTMKRRWQEPEIIEKMARRKRGVVTEATRKKLSKANSGKNNAMYGMTGELNPNYGKPISAERKQKMQEGRERYQAERKRIALEKNKTRTEKKCCRCKEIFSLDLFQKSKQNLTGYLGMCKSCDRKRGREKYYKLHSPYKVRNRYGKLIKDIIKGGKNENR